MAGDWIKMRGNLWDDPRVSRICDLTGSKESTVIGGLYWLWNSADQHTENGLMVGLTLGAIDRKSGVKGLSAALVTVGWLREEPDGARIINFEDHNGSSAKRRSEDAKRKANVRKDSDKTRTDNGIPAELLGRIAELEKELEEEKSRGSVAKATGGEPPDPVKQEIWDAGRSLLTASRMPAKQAGTFLGKLVGDYKAPVVLEAVRAAVKEQPADAAEYLKATCMRLAGERAPPNRQEALEATNNAVLQRVLQGDPDVAH